MNKKMLQWLGIDKTLENYERDITWLKSHVEQLEQTVENLRKADRIEARSTEAKQQVRRARNWTEARAFLERENQHA